jgi:hypothetical protein
VIQAAELEQLKAERFDLGQHAEQRCLVTEDPDEHGVGSIRLRAQAWECATERLAQAPPDPDLVVHRFCWSIHASRPASLRFLGRHHRDGLVSGHHMILMM